MPCAIIAKTELGMEKYVANSLEVPCEVEGAPRGFQGLVILKECKDWDEAYEKLLKMPEVIRAMKAEKCVRAEMEELKRAAEELAEELEGKRFAVRTVRRGKHPFTSMQVNAELGSVILSKVNAKVDLTNPEKVLMVEIVGDEAYLAIVEPEYAGMKKLKGKPNLEPFFKKVIVVQEPYLGPRKSTEELGKRIGRIVQSFGISKYVFGLTEESDAISLANLIKAIEEGAKSRYEQQIKTERKGKMVELKVFDVYHEVGSRSKKDLVIIFEPEGKTVDEVREELLEKIRKSKRIVLVLGSRKGTPMGLYRFADFVIDLSPGVVLSTETALAASLELIASLAAEALKGREDKA